MAIYILLLLSILLGGIVMRVSSLPFKSRKLVLCVVVGGELILLAALRDYSVGTDLNNYIPGFLYIGEYFWNGLYDWGGNSPYYWEPGYMLLNIVIYKLSINPHIFLALIGLIVVVSFIRFIAYNSPIIWLSLFIFVSFGYYLSSYNILRQYLAIACVLKGIQTLIDGRVKSYIFWVLIAITFHATAFCVFLLYPLTKFKANLKYFVVFLTIMSLCYFFCGRYILAYFVDIFYDTYSDDMVKGQGGMMLTLLVVITFVGLWVIQKSQVEKFELRVLSHMMILACALQLWSLDFSLFSRMVLYFQLALIVFIPSVLSLLKNKYLGLYGQFIVAILMFVYFVCIFSENDLNGVIPYRFFWEKGSPFVGL